MGVSANRSTSRIHKRAPAIRSICAHPRGRACNPIDLCMSMRPICNSMKKCMDYVVHWLIELRIRCLSSIKHQLDALLNFLPSECFCSFFNRMVSGATRCSNELRMAVFLQFALQLNGELQATHCVRMGLGQGPPKGGHVLPAGTQQPLRAGHVHASYPEAAASRSKKRAFRLR